MDFAQCAGGPRPRRHGRRRHPPHQSYPALHPNNPTGVPISHHRLEAFLQSVRPDVLVVIDEAYVEYADAGSGPDSLALYRRHPNVCILRTFSKAYGLPACGSGTPLRRRPSPKDCGAPPCRSP
ncbi:bifunctional pyridoxal-dependent enzyme with beta-cystathionase and maltose regulon repressor activities [Pseudarthrobacter sp. SLBN-100]